MEFQMRTDDQRV